MLLKLFPTKKFILFVLLFFISFQTESSFADEIKTESVEKKVRFGISTGITVLSYIGTPANGAGAGVSIQYAISEKWGLKTSFNQAFYLTGFAPLYSEFDIRAVYALTGSLISKKENLFLGKEQVLKTEEYSSGGWRLEAQSDIYFFSSISSVIPFTGIGFGASYEFPSTNETNYNAGIRMDFISSSKVNLNPIQLFIEILF